MPRSIYNDPAHVQTATIQVLRRVLEESSTLRIENQRLFNYASQLEAELAATEADPAAEPAKESLKDETKSDSKETKH